MLPLSLRTAGRAPLLCRRVGAAQRAALARSASNATTPTSPDASAPGAPAAQPPAPSAAPGLPLVPPVAASVDSVDLPYYSQFPLDRHAEWRRDQPMLDALMARPDARIVPLLRDKVLVRPTVVPTAVPTAPTAPAGPAEAPPPLLHPVLLSPADLAAADGADPEPTADAATAANRQPPPLPLVFLGTDAAGAPYFAAAVASPAAAAALAAAQPGSEWRSARAAGPDLARGDASLLAVASGLMTWHATNGFSAATGAPSRPSPGGYSRKCGLVRVRTCVCVLFDVSFQQRLPQGRRAALEVGLLQHEVTAVLGPLQHEVAAVPGPRQELQWPQADVEELADVRWFHRDWLRAVALRPQPGGAEAGAAGGAGAKAAGGAAGEAAGGRAVAGAGEFNVPGPWSLAHRLILGWAGEGGGGGSGGGGGAREEAGEAWVGDAFPQVHISGSGTFKYVLMRLWDPEAAEAAAGGGAARSKLLVWGDERAPYHNDVLRRAKSAAAGLGLQ
ncbi:hypothetical protein TSOC_007972, partial [Tetrabaena socialis]